MSKRTSKKRAIESEETDKPKIEISEEQIENSARSITQHEINLIKADSEASRLMLKNLEAEFKNLNQMFVEFKDELVELGKAIRALKSV